MAQARPLHDLFAGLAHDAELAAGGSGTPDPAGGTDPAELLRAAGHEDLPEGLVAEAIVSYADTAPPEVAAHLAPFVTPHSAVAAAYPAADPAAAGTGEMDLAAGFDLLTTAPATATSAELAELSELDGAADPFDLDADPDAPELDAPELGTVDPDLGYADGSDLGFGAGGLGPELADPALADGLTAGPAESPADSPAELPAGSLLDGFDPADTLDAGLPPAAGSDTGTSAETPPGPEREEFDAG